MGPEAARLCRPTAQWKPRRVYRPVLSRLGLLQFSLVWRRVLGQAHALVAQDALVLTSLTSVSAPHLWSGTLGLAQSLLPAQDQLPKSGSSRESHKGQVHTGGVGPWTLPPSTEPLTAQRKNHPNSISTVVSPDFRLLQRSRLGKYLGAATTLCFHDSIHSYQRNGVQDTSVKAVG